MKPSAGAMRIVRAVRNSQAEEFFVARDVVDAEVRPLVKALEAIAARCKPFSNGSTDVLPERARAALKAWKGEG